jgi:single stranded DNA-binding protein
MYVNTVVIVGNLTSDPRLGEGNGNVVNFRMAVNRWRRTDEESEDRPERTEYIDVECWGAQAANVNSSLHKGDRAVVAGQLKYDQWSDDGGAMKSRMKIKAHAVGLSLEFRNPLA